jgi:uncharacterized lipoprotein YddW (UPF0748 family)
MKRLLAVCTSLLLGSAYAQDMTGLTEPTVKPVNVQTLKAWQQQLREEKTLLWDALELSVKTRQLLAVNRVQQALWSADQYLNPLLFSPPTDAAAVEGLVSRAQSHFREARRLLSPTIPVEGRAVWLDRGSIVQCQGPDDLRRMIRALVESGVNIIYFETINAGYPLYQTDKLAPNPLLSGTWDPLGVAVEEGHRLGVEVHAWVWCFAVGNIRHNRIVGRPDEDPGPILSKPGMMNLALRGGQGQLVPNRQHEYWLSPANPQSRAFLLDLYSDIVRRYPVDGLQLDYIRYPFQSMRAPFGYEAADRFEEETGLKVTVLDDFTVRSWAVWKALQVTDFVKQVSDTLRPIRPNLTLSAAVYPMPRAERLLAVQQDWETWLANGWLDTLSPMTYTSSPKEYAATLERLTASTDKPIYPGVGLHKLDDQELLKLIDITQQTPTLGHTLFAQAHLDNRKLTALSEGPYRQRPAVLPHRPKAVDTLARTFLQQISVLDETPEALKTQLELLLSNPDKPNAPTVEKIRELTASTVWNGPYRTRYFNSLALRISRLAQRP